ncbi:MAG: hypothetical protein QOH83_46, partial [Solirubrobacteraceae bacterium]|nr:hypothetical protein [Solirubrobacteraceae bacterium]
VPSGGTLRAVSTSGTVVTLTISEGSDAADTSAGSFKIALAAGASAVRDAAGNQASFAATAPSDLAAPTLSGLQMVDSDANGKVDEVRATFDEPLATSTATAPWTLTNVPSGGTLRAVSTSGTVVTLTIDEGSDAADTSVGSFKVALAASPSAIRDAAGNQASLAATAPRDLAGPVLMTATSAGGTATNLMQPGDTLALTFSEALAPSSVPAGPDVTESRSSSTATLAIAGLITPTTIDVEYLDESGDSATFSTASALTNRTVTVTLDTGTANGSVPADSGGASILPAASLKDPAGNPAASAAPAAARRVSRLF